MHAAKGAEDSEKATSTAILARSRHFLREARGAHVQLNTWIPSVSAFEEAVLELETVEIAEKEGKEVRRFVSLCPTGSNKTKSSGLLATRIARCICSPRRRPRRLRLR